MSKCKEKIKPKSIFIGTFKFGRNLNVKYPSGDGYSIFNEENAECFLKECLALGINGIDTAPSYGVAECLVGNAIKSLNARSSFLISTKVGESHSNVGGLYDFTFSGMQRSLEKSLENLNCSEVDYLFLHCKSDQTIIENDVMRFIEYAKDNGLSRKIGVSVSNIKFEKSILSMFDAAMLPYNIEYRSYEEMFNFCKENNVETFAKKILASGHISNQSDVYDALKFISRSELVDTIILGTSSLTNLKSSIKTMKD